MPKDLAQRLKVQGIYVITNAKLIILTCLKCKLVIVVVQRRGPLEEGYSLTFLPSISQASKYCGDHHLATTFHSQELVGNLLGSQFPYLESWTCLCLLCS